MITVTLNRTEFEYDIHSLIKAFFPKEDVELYYTKEAHADEKNVACTNHSAEQEEAGSSHFSIDYADDRISIAWDDAPDGPARRTFAVDFSNRTETKNALKEHLYRLLEEETGQPLPWGTLTGIRPTKIPMQMLDEGKTKEEIASYMKQTYLASDEKINLSIAIAERERALLSQLDYKNGYSLYIGIPFCPSTCLTNCYFAINDETKELIIIDPGYSPKQLAERVRQEGCTPVAILLTHGHFDHATGAADLAKEFSIPVYAYETEKETLENEEMNLCHMTGEHHVFHADIYLKDEQELDLAGFHIRVLHTPGHTPGGCCYYFPYENVVFSGDTLFCTSVGRTDFPGGSMSDIIRSIKEKLMTLPDRTTVYPGHNDVTTIENERMYNPYL